MGPNTADLQLVRCLIPILLFCTAPSFALAQTFPSAPVKIVVPVTAGGAPDVVTRIVAEKLAAKLGHPVIVENRPGAGERIGAEFVAKAEPDGHTLLAAPPGALVLASLLYSTLSYDPNAMVPVTVLTTGHLVLVARPNIPVTTLEELVALAKARPGKLSYASPGAGTPPHLTGEMLMAASNIQTTHVPYKGLAPAVTDLLAGHVDIMFDNLGNSLAHIKNGRLKALAIASDKRIVELPDVPAISETYPGFRSAGWFGVVAPPKTPAGIVEKISGAMAEILKHPDVAKKLHALSFTPVGNSPSEMAAFLKEERERWRAVVAGAGIKQQ